MYLESRWNVSDRTCFSWKTLVHLNRIKGVSSVKLARHFWIFLQNKNLLVVPAVGLEWNAGGWSCWGWRPLVRVCSARDAMPGMPVWAWVPPQPAAIRRAKPSRPPGLGAGIEPVPVPLQLPGIRRGAGTELRGCPAGSGPGTAHPSLRSRPATTAKKQSQEDNSELWKGEKRRRVRCYLRWLRL